MTVTEIENEIVMLQAANAAIALKSAAVGMVGSIAGLLYGKHQKATFWGKTGYFFAGGYTARLPMTLFYADTLAKNIARIDQLQRLLNNL